MEDEPCEDDFTRNPQVELEAVRRLHYTVAEVKRKTIHELRKELGGAANKSPTKRSPVSEMKKLLEAKKAHYALLQDDPDFDQEDLDDWLQSMAKLERHIQNATMSKVTQEAQKWQRKQAKLRELDQAGLLDDDLAQKWKAKQTAIKASFSK